MYQLIAWYHLLVFFILSYHYLTTHTIALDPLITGQYCVCVCMCACVRACVRVRVCVCVCVQCEINMQNMYTFYHTIHSNLFLSLACPLYPPLSPFLPLFSIFTHIRQIILATGEEQCKKIEDVFTEFTKQLRGLKGLPLPITSVQGASPEFRHTAVFPATPWNGRMPRKMLAATPSGVQSDCLYPSCDSATPPFIPAMEGIDTHTLTVEILSVTSVCVCVCVCVCISCDTVGDKWEVADRAHGYLSH